MELTTSFPFPAKALLRRSNLILEKASNHPLLLIIIHWLCLAAMDFPYWKLIGPFALGVTFLTKDRVRTFSRLNIIFFLLSGGLLSITLPGVDSEVQLSQASMTTVLSSAGLIAAIYFILFNLMLRQKIFRRPVTICSIIVVILGVAAVKLSEIAVLNAIALASFIAMIRVRILLVVES